MARLRYLPLLFSSHLFRFSSAALHFPLWRVAQLFRLGRASAPSFLPGLLPSFLPSLSVSAVPPLLPPSVRTASRSSLASTTLPLLTLPRSVCHHRIPHPSHLPVHLIFVSRLTAPFIFISVPSLSSSSSSSSYPRPPPHTAPAPLFPSLRAFLCLFLYPHYITSLPQRPLPSAPLSMCASTRPVHN
ncbi:hypothetical protein C8J57DRAFT_1513376 [Mycena rebaudengoi]|nr:hypothetical protein C8J57DRAFT_1513376 [Mycena rebaudengoi]